MNNHTGIYEFTTFDPFQTSILVHFLSFIQAIDPLCDLEGLKTYIRNPDHLYRQLVLWRSSRQLPVHSEEETISQGLSQSEAFGEVQGALETEPNTPLIPSRLPLSDMSNTFNITSAYQASSSSGGRDSQSRKRRRRSLTPPEEDLPAFFFQAPPNWAAEPVTNPAPAHQPAEYYSDERFFLNENHVRMGTLPLPSPQLDSVQLQHPYPQQLNGGQLENSYPSTPAIYHEAAPSESGANNTPVASPASDLSHPIPSWRSPQDLQVYCQWQDCDQFLTPHTSIASLRTHLKAHSISSSKGNRDKKRMDCKWGNCQANSSLCSIMNHVMTHVPEARDLCGKCHKQVLCRDKKKHQKECWS
ncbi:hypothetical protein BJ165DRAFT_1520614 [Panaeolus papilionaceus]|nr:hypothetical protein BJ165DRAFT_1520614 [Panaeolus papilionaceus]